MLTADYCSVRAARPDCSSLPSAFGGFPGTCTLTCAKAVEIGNAIGWGDQGGSPYEQLEKCPITAKVGCGDISNIQRAPPPVRKDCPPIRGMYPAWAMNIYAAGEVGSINDDSLNCAEVLTTGGNNTGRMISLVGDPFGVAKGDPGATPYPNTAAAAADVYSGLLAEGVNCHGCSTDAKVAPVKPLNSWGGGACTCYGAYRIHGDLGKDMGSDIVGGGGPRKQCRYSSYTGLEKGDTETEIIGKVGTGCSGRGVCSSSYADGGFCVCDKGYSGIDCSIKDDDPSATVVPLSPPPPWCGWMDPAVGPGPWEEHDPLAKKDGNWWQEEDGWASADAPSPIKVSADYCADKAPRGWTSEKMTTPPSQGYTDWAAGNGSYYDGQPYKHMDVQGCYSLLKPWSAQSGCSSYFKHPHGGSSPPPSGGSSPPPSSGSSPPPSGGSSPPPSGGSSPPPSGGSSPPPSGGSSPPPSGGSSPPPSGGSSPPPSGGSGSHQYINPERQINRYISQNGRTYKKGQYQPAPNPHFHFEIPGPAYTCKAGQQWCVALQKCSLLNDCPK